MKFLLLFFIIFCIWFFVHVNEKNYQKMKEIKYEIVKHPEMLPKKELAKFWSLWFTNLRADIYWLETIQYIGWNAVWAEYKKYLFQMIDLITELNPYFEKPYLITQLLLPDYNERYEKLDKKEINNNQKNAETIGLKWIKNFCDEEKINLITKENNLDKIWSEEKYKNPCKSFEIPFNQWFLYYYYLKDFNNSAKYYKISSANENALIWAKTMTAIMTWKSWNKEISIMMFLTLADVNAWKNEDCIYFSNFLKNESYNIFRQDKKITTENIKNINNLRKKYFTFDEEKEKDMVKDDYSCISYINKAVREFNLAYIEQANEKYKKDNNKNSNNAKELFEEKYLEYLPVDFQQYKDYGIIYFYNEETKWYDYKMWKY